MCLKRNAAGPITKDSAAFICQVLSNLDSRLRVTWLTQMARPIQSNRWRDYARRYEEEKRIRELFQELEGYLSTLGPRCQNYVDSFIAICSMGPLKTPSSRASFFTKALDGPSPLAEKEHANRNHFRELSRYNLIFSRPARRETQAWERELRKDCNNPLFDQARYGLALLECKEIFTKAQTNLSDSEFSEAWSLILSLDEASEAYRHDIGEKLAKIYEKARLESAKHAIDRTKLETYLGSASKEESSLDLYLKHQVIKDAWTRIFSLTEVEFISDVLYAFLRDILQFGYKFRLCKRCGKLFFYTGPNNQYCNRYYRGLDVVCSSAKVAKLVRKKGGRELNGTIQKIKQRARNKSISYELGIAYHTWAKEAHTLGMYYAQEPSIDVDLWYQWRNLILPKKQAIDEANSTLPRMIIWDDKVIDGNTLVRVPLPLARELQMHKMVTGNKTGQRTKDKRGYASELCAADLQLACIQANTSQKSSKISLSRISREVDVQ